MCIFALYTIYTKVYILFVQQNQINKTKFLELHTTYSKENPFFEEIC